MHGPALSCIVCIQFTNWAHDTLHSPYRRWSIYRPLVSSQTFFYGWVQSICPFFLRLIWRKRDFIGCFGIIVSPYSTHAILAGGFSHTIPLFVLYHNSREQSFNSRVVEYVYPFIFACQSRHRTSVCFRCRESIIKRQGVILCPLGFFLVSVGLAKQLDVPAVSILLGNSFIITPI